MPISMAFFRGYFKKIPFNVPIKNRNRVGGVMTPPYENIPLNYNLSLYLNFELTKIPISKPKGRHLPGVCL